MGLAKRSIGNYVLKSGLKAKFSKRLVFSNCQKSRKASPGWLASEKIKSVHKPRASVQCFHPIVLRNKNSSTHLFVSTVLAMVDPKFRLPQGVALSCPSLTFGSGRFSAQVVQIYKRLWLKSGRLRSHFGAIFLYSTLRT